MGFSISQVNKLAALEVARPVLEYLRNANPAGRFSARMNTYDLEVDIVSEVRVVEQGPGLLRKLFPRRIADIAYSSLLGKASLTSHDLRLPQKTLAELLKNIDIKGIIFGAALTSQRADDYY